MNSRIKEIKPSARKHRISDARIQHVVDNSQPIDVPAHPTFEGTMVLFLGSDQNGIALEVMAREDEDGRWTVFHADKMRSSYSAKYRESMK